MSRIGLSPIEIPGGVKVEIMAGNELTVEGKKGKLKEVFNKNLKITKEGNIIKVERSDNTNFYKALHGLTRNLINNMIIGVTEGFQKKLEISGVGFKAQITGKKVTFQLGFSHPVIFDIPEGIEIKLEEQGVVVVSGIDKQKVGHVAAGIRSLRVPDPYKLKGIKISGEYIKRKAGKSAKK
ncbi:50S ribosomal protein L6 [Candidatus Desantisbacteria bacterium]|nr:50S ribosomal protein L6 [Candidatus Desantisbacteria bacterium]